eukprot:TRINITY_DN1242_c4_g1_i4.p1 TRINITY_DN1242_c4_g1~~TRINITY_DN1242_c4_g1_i4.p1  ORF type:complete len:335 (-),score=26.30 TRINITY_DN1242_c4_g1_i4:335-1339(-)
MRWWMGHQRKKQKISDQEELLDLNESLHTEIRNKDEDSEDEIDRQVKRSPKFQRTMEEQKCTVFVQNLPKNIKTAQLRYLFQDCGEIDSVRFRNIALKAECKMPYQKAVLSAQNFNKEHTSISAYIRFMNEDSAEKAVMYNMRVLKGHHIKVVSSAQEKLDNSKAVFIGNLSPEVQDEEVIQLFHGDAVGEENKGQVVNYRLIRDHRTQLSKGIGFVQFKTRKTAKAIIRLNGTLKLNGRTLRITQIDSDARPSQSRGINKGQGVANRGRQNQDDQKWQGLKTKGSKRKGVRGSVQVEKNKPGKSLQKVQKQRKGKRPAVAARKMAQLKAKRTQ